MAETVVSLKRCTICHQSKPSTEFCRDASRGDGLDAQCKECRRAASRRYGKTTAGKKAQLRYACTTKGKARDHRHYLAIKGTTRAKSRLTVRNQIKAGHLPRARTLKCARCAEPADSYHHYLGYDPEHWLSVIPLCKSCHRQADSEST